MFVFALRARESFARSAQGQTIPQSPGPEQAKPEPKAQRNFAGPDSRMMKDLTQKELVQVCNAQEAAGSRAQSVVVEADPAFGQAKGQRGFRRPLPGGSKRPEAEWRHTCPARDLLKLFQPGGVPGAPGVGGANRPSSRHGQARQGKSPRPGSRQANGRKKAYSWKLIPGRLLVRGRLRRKGLRSGQPVLAIMATFQDACTQEALFQATEGTADGGEWATPQDFFDGLDAEFRFTLDAAASDSNRKCPSYYTKEQDALRQPWDGAVFCNPPYGRQIGKWLKRGREAAAAGATVVFLIHARTDTRWFHEHVYGIADKIRFVRGRLKFGRACGRANSAPFPSMVVVYHPKSPP
jgi:phage N-6-adenine-methyltransferase